MNDNINNNTHVPYQSDDFLYLMISGFAFPIEKYIENFKNESGIQLKYVGQIEYDYFEFALIDIKEVPTEIIIEFGLHMGQIYYNEYKENRL